MAAHAYNLSANENEKILSFIHKQFGKNKRVGLTLGQITNICIENGLRLLVLGFSRLCILIY